MNAPGVALLVHGWGGAGGMERQAARLARSLRKSGHRVVVVTTAPAGSTEPVHEVVDGLELFRQRVSTRSTEEAFHRAYEALAARVLARRPVSVVVAFHALTGAHAVEAAQVAALPVVVRFAGAGPYGDFAAVNSSRERSRVVELLRRVDRFACISDEVRREAVLSGLDPARCVLLRTGVDRARFQPEGERAALEADVLFVGRLSEEKRVHVLLDALARLPGVKLALAGAGPEEARLRERARELGLAERVQFLGAREDVPALLRAARAFVLPSASEGLPNALLEALATGVPCVATDVPGTNEVVRHEEEALLVPPDDAGALARALGRVLEDGELAARLVVRGRARVGGFDEAAALDRWKELIASVARRARPRLGRLARLHARAAWALGRGVASGVAARLGARPDARGERD